MIQALTPDPVASRRSTVRATGSYWGGGGEQIDTLSGNLNGDIDQASENLYDIEAAAQ